MKGNPKKNVEFGMLRRQDKEQYKEFTFRAHFLRDLKEKSLARSFFIHPFLALAPYPSNLYSTTAHALRQSALQTACADMSRD